MDREPDLRPADRDDLVNTLSYGLRYDDRGKPSPLARDLIAALAAETLLARLEAQGYVIMQKPPARAHSTP